ncbi:putative Ig domain-containing protein [Flavobacterium terrigena]|uniref:Putative Ig domain-containing protein n=1 Tax=Flavobacterium terrigena TaxID=402734 RepID=A0A1H6TVI9_9FLAO|nr:putative Ig domain-containing protein [Flavobacterium terrigena]SEI82234.1 Putative Ig domain-containing protein [Flavobacterium terrigena]
MKIKLLFGLFLVSVLNWGQVNITPIRTDVTGFPTWADTAITGTTYLQLITNTSTTISPTMNFSGYTSITLDFKARMFGGPSAAEKVITVSISTDGSTWTTLGTNSPATTTLTAVTQYNLNTYIGQTTVRLRFQTLAAAGSRGSGIDDIDIKGTIPGCTAPATQASAITTNGETLDGFNINWTAGDGNGTMIVIRPSVAGTTAPVSGTVYTPNTAWASAGQIDTNNRVVFRGVGTTTGTLTGLTAGTQYTVNAYEYNTAGNCYKTTPSAIGTGYTRALEPTAHAATFSCTTVSTTQINLAFPSRATIPNARAYLILQKIGSAPTGVPTDGGFYVPGATIGDATVVGSTALDGTETSYSVTGLTPGTNYYFSIIPFNAYLSVPSTINYNTNATIPITNCTTNSLSPPVITSVLTGSGAQGSSFTYTITATNTPTSYNATGLPTGLSINTTTGVISGTPSVSGTFNVTITATNGFGSDNQTLVITLGTGPCLSEAFAVNALPAGWIQTSVTFASNRAEFSSNNGQLTTVAVSNPASLTFTLERTGSTVVKTMLIEVSTTTQGGTYTTVATYDHSNTTSSGTVNCTVDLSAYTSFSTVYIRFRKASASSVARWGLDDIQVFCAAPCTPATITATPTSGPVGTEVTITASTGSLTGASVSFGGINATIVSNDGTQMVAVVPIGATTGNIKVTDAQPCDATTAFTLISKDNSSCEGTSPTTDLIIYDIHDEQTGSGGFITLYNGTVATVNLTNYSIWRTTVYGDGNEIDYANLTGTIAPGALAILKVSVGSCGPASTNGTIDGGFNDDDGIQLRNATGSVIIDDVHTYVSGPGYYMVRNTGALNARTSYVAADWSTTPLIAGECYPSAGLTLPSGASTPPIVTTHPTYLPSCGSTSAVLTSAGNEGYSGGNTLAYQWYFAAPGSTTWAAVTDGGIYSGATTASLSISNVTGVLNYQYYCQIRENSATCYSATNAVKITDTSASTWNGSAWIGGTPTITKAAIIDGTYVTATNGDFSCCSLTVNSGVGRSLTISSGGYVEVQNNITNNGILDVLSDGSLVQISDAGVNTGNIRYYRTANIRKQDYVYWSSPVASFASNAVSPGTSLGYQYKWLPTTTGTNNFGNWAFANETMVLGKGYCLRGPDYFSLSALTNYTATFTGVPNNGVVTIPISRGNWNGGTYSTGVSTTLGTNEDDNWNLVGNPYPSAIHAINFLTLNTNIAGFVNIWTHGTLPSNATADPFYNDYAYNYTPSDYITYNAAGASSGPGVFNGRIAGGQGFFVSMLHTSAVTTENLIFNNSLRNKVHNNSQFYRTSANTINNGDLEKHRIWFDLVTPSGTSVRSLLGYVEEATNGKDRLFDAFSNQKLSFNIFSLIEEEQMLIQGRTLPFDNNDKVNIGVSIPQDGMYKIALGAVDGLFLNPNQNIYLEDKLLNVIYDLKNDPYSFMANKGTIKDRFVIRYTNGTVLANETFDANNDVVVVSNQELSVLSTKEKIKSILVYDVLGRKLFEGKDIEANNFTLPITKHNVPLLIEIGLENGIKINRKTIY